MMSQTNASKNQLHLSPAMVSQRGLRFYWFTSAFHVGKFLPKYDFSRYVEHALVSLSLSLPEGGRILDIGSGYSILPLYLAATRNYSVHITDNEAYLPNVLRFHNKKAHKLNLMADLREGKIAIEHQDGRSLSYPDGSFDRVMCISVIQHIPGADDTKVIKEIARVLRPGGQAILTFPYARRYEERPFAPWVEYFTRSYDETAIQNRLVDPSGLREIRRIYFGEGSVHISRMYWRDIPRPLRTMFQVSTPLWAALCMQVGREPKRTSHGVLLTLQKEDGVSV